MSCIIQANPDAAGEYKMPLLCHALTLSATGIGVRISVYIQAFLPLLPLLVQIGAGMKLVKEKEMQENARQSIIYLLFTGMALLISAIIQQHAYGLSVFHALIVLNLCWITVVGAIAPFYFLATLPDTNWMLSPTGVTTKIARYVWALIAQLIFMGGFGLWLISNIWTFDTTPGACTPSMVYYILGHLVHVTDRPFRRAMLALYSILSIPLVNAVIPMLLFFLVWAILATAFICMFPGTTRTVTPAEVAQAAQAGRAGANGASPLPAPPPPPGDMLQPNDSALAITIALSSATIHAIMILSVEKTIQSNNVSSDDEQWRLGQTFAIMLSLIPFCGMCNQIAGAMFGWENEEDEGNNGGGASRADQEGSMSRTMSMASGTNRATA